MIQILNTSDFNPGPTEKPAGLQVRSENTQSGFGFSLIAVVIALVMGLTASMAFRQVSTQTEELVDTYSASQAHWTAMSGIEWGIYKAELGENDVLGTFDFFNSTVTIDTSASDESGTPLTTNYYRVMSEGKYGEAKSRFRIIAAFSLLTDWADVSIIEVNTGWNQEFNLTNDFTLNDSIYFGEDVKIADGSTIGDTSIGEPTHIYHHPDFGVTVTTGDHEFLTYGTYPYGTGELYLPDFDNSYYDDLIAVAAGISSTNASAGEWRGSKTWSETTLNLDNPNYDNKTIYVNGNVTFKSTHITGGSVDAPGIIVADGSIKLKKARGGWRGPPKAKTMVDDNIIMISRTDITIQDSTYYGFDHTDSLTAEDRPITTNEVYAKDDLQIKAGTTVWGQLYCRDDIKLEGVVYGICLAPSKFTFEKSTSYLEGAVFAHELNRDRLDNGQMVLNHIYNDEYFKLIDFGVEDNSLYEY